MGNQDEIMSKDERKKKIEEMERKKAKRDIEGERSSVLTVKKKNKPEEEDE